MMKMLNQAIKALSVIFLGMALVACTDTDGPAEDLVGTVASGEAIQGTIYVVDAEGVELNRPINVDGSFRFDVRKLTAPFMLKAVASNGTDPDLYSFAEVPNVAVNVTPLSNIAMFIANGNADPAILYDSWSSSFGNITSAIVKDAKAVVNANLRPQFMAFSLDPFTYDFIGTRFFTNGTSVDGMMEALIVDVSAGAINVSVAGIGALIFDTGIDIAGYDIGGTSVAETGNYTLTLSVSVDEGAASFIYLLINLPAADLPSVGNTQLVEDMFKSFYGTEGLIVINSTTVTTDEVVPTTTYAKVDATITTQDAVVKNYIATYTYTLNP